MPGYARITRTATLALKNAEFILAERSLGAGPLRLMVSHFLPNLVSPLLILASMDIPVVITVEAGLSFLGLGVRAPMTSWGVLLNDAQNVNVIALYPWLMLPVVPVIIVVLAFNFMGDGLRDAADPYG